MKRKKFKPTNGEMEIMEALWNIGPASVREIHDLLENKNEAKAKSYTTTLKFIQNMYAKGLVTREQVGHKHIYRPTITAQDDLRDKLDHIVEQTFKGSSSQLVMQILGHHKTSKEELQKIREFLDELDQKNK